jgi:hypothetical protein
MQPEPLATFHYTAGNVVNVLEFLKRTRVELRMMRKVQVWPEHLRVFDVNGDCFEVTGIGYVDENIRPILDAVLTSYNPDTIHNPFAGEYKEFKTGKRHPWAEDRVM